MIKPSSTGTGKYEELLAACHELTPVATAVAYPCGESALTAVIEASRAGLLESILVGRGDLRAGRGMSPLPNVWRFR